MIRSPFAKTALALLLVAGGNHAAMAQQTSPEQLSAVFEMPGQALLIVDPAQQSQTSQNLKNILNQPQVEYELLDAELGLARVTGLRGQTRNLKDILAELARQPGVKHVAPNQILSATPVRAKPAAQPNPGRKQQWYLDEIGVDAAWRLGADGKGITVAVIDNGVDWQHGDLRQNIWVNSDEIPGNGIDDDRNGYIDDAHGWDFGEHDNNPTPIVCNDISMSHGTHVAGVIGAVHDNGGLDGMAPGVRIMPLKIQQKGGGPCGRMSSDGMLQAIIYAARNGADIINLSLGGAKPNVVAEYILESLQDEDIIFVVSAGNDGLDNDSASPIAVRSILQGREIIAIAPSYPASFTLDNIISVASTTQGRQPGQDDLSVWNANSTPFLWQQVADFRNGRWVSLPRPIPRGSNYGRSSVDIAAPGDEILSTFAGNEFGNMSGTSMAAPVISGAAALLKSLNPKLSAGQIKQILMRSAAPRNGLASRVKSGGRLDMAAAARMALAQKASPPVVARTPEPVEQPEPPATGIADGGNDETRPEEPPVAPQPVTTPVAKPAMPTPSKPNPKPSPKTVNLKDLLK